MIFNPGGVINTAGFFPDGAMMAFLEFNNISKGYPGVQALSSVSFGVDKGAIHGLMGENGAGKSTLIRILSGDQAADQGSILIGGEEQRMRSMRASSSSIRSFSWFRSSPLPKISGSGAFRARPG